MGRFRALRSASTAVGGRHRLLKKAGENFSRGGENFIMAKTLMVMKSDSAKTKALPFAKATLSFYCFCSSAYFFGLSPVSFLKI